MLLRTVEDALRASLGIRLETHDHREVVECPAPTALELLARLGRQVEVNRRRGVSASLQRERRRDAGIAPLTDDLVALELAPDLDAGDRYFD